MIDRVSLDQLRLPTSHREFLGLALPRLAADGRILGILAAGSVLSQSMDEFSDLDLVIALEPAAEAAVRRERFAIVDGLGPLLAAFTGEHVGEPRLIIALYDRPLLHVDFKFVSLPDLAVRVDDPLVLCERGSSVSDALRRGVASYPQPSPQWMEDRFWVWVHYVAAKVGRGELFEALDGIANLRRIVLGPLSLALNGAIPNGVRRLEFHAADFIESMKLTIAGYDGRACIRALRAAAELYVHLQQQCAAPGVVRREDARCAALEYVSAIEERLSGRHRFPEPG